jgi:mannosyltransferase
MEKKGKVYGFSIMIKEISTTVPNLFRYTSAYKRSRGLGTTGMWNVFLEDPPIRDPQSPTPLDPDYVSPEGMNGEVYNMCHFWSNFEIASLDFYRSQEYNDYFEFLDATGGFWRERWGDAPIHSLAAGLFLEPSQVHYFRDIGYRHTTIMHCPANAPGNQLPHIPYLRDTIDAEEDTYWSKPDKPMLNGVGCRCRCDTDIREDETSNGGCITHWVNKTGGWLDD